MEMTIKDYQFVQTMARKFAYGNVKTNVYEEYINAGIEGLNKALTTYKDGSDISFFTYLYRCVMNAMINEQKKMELHKIEENDNVNTNLENYEGAFFEMPEDNFEKTLRSAIRKHTTNERNAQIVELAIGLNCEKLELKEIAAKFNLSHESVRLVFKNAQKDLCNDMNTKSILLSFVG